MFLQAVKQSSVQEDEDGGEDVDGDGDDSDGRDDGDDGDRDDGEDDDHEMTFSNVLPSNQATKASIGRKVLGSSNFISAGKPHGVNFIVCIMTAAFERFSSFTNCLAIIENFGIFCDLWWFVATSGILC